MPVGSLKDYFNASSLTLRWIEHVEIRHMVEVTWCHLGQIIPTTPAIIYKKTFNIATQIITEKRSGAETKSKMKNENHSQAVLWLEETLLTQRKWPKSQSVSHVHELVVRNSGLISAQVRRGVDACASESSCGTYLTYLLIWPVTSPSHKRTCTEHLCTPLNTLQPQFGSLL